VTDLLALIDDAIDFGNRRIAKVETDAARSRRDEVQARVMPGLVKAIEEYFVGLAGRLGVVDFEGSIAKAPFLAAADWNAENSLLLKAMLPAYNEMLSSGLYTTYEQVATAATAFGDVNFNLPKANIAVAGSLSLGDYDLSIRDQLGQRIVGITETTRAQVEGIVARGVEQGLSPKRIANGTLQFDGIKQYVAQTYRNRAYVIALTETASAYNLGQLQGYRQAGIEKVRIFDGDDCGWTSHDDPDRASGSVRTLAEAQAYPTAHPNCQRSWSPYFEGIEQTPATAQGDGAVDLGDGVSFVPAKPTPSPTVGQPPPSPSPTTAQTLTTRAPQAGEFREAVDSSLSFGDFDRAARVWAQSWQDDIAARRLSDPKLPGRYPSDPAKSALDELRDYTGGGHRRVNSAARGTWEETFGEKPTEAVLRTQFERADRISSTMRPVADDVKVYRGTHVDQFGLDVDAATHAQVMETLKPGARFIEDGFSSTSIHPKSAFSTKSNNAVRLTIEVPKGTRAAYVDDISQYQGERELLLDKGREYVVRSIDAVQLPYGAGDMYYYDVVLQVVA